MINIAICDDEVEITSKIEYLILNICQKHMIDTDISVFFDGSTLVEAIYKGIEFDLVYLDIEMKYENGLEAAHKIRKINEDVLIFYISSHENYLKELFDVQPFCFLNKPIDNNKFQHYFLRAREHVENLESYFEFRYNKVYYKIKVGDIIYFESKCRLILIHTKMGTEKFYGKLNKIEEIFSKTKITFLRTHQSFLVNYKFIKKITFYTVELYNGTVLSISLDKQKKLREQYCDEAGGNSIVCSLFNL